MGKVIPEGSNFSICACSFPQPVAVILNTAYHWSGFFVLGPTLTTEDLNVIQVWVCQTWTVAHHVNNNMFELAWVAFV